LFASTCIRPVTSWPLTMLPALRIVRTPVERTSAMPDGTPVLLPSGYPQADGRGRHPTAAGLGGGVVLELTVGCSDGLAVGVRRPIAGGVAEALEEAVDRLGPIVRLALGGGVDGVSEGLAVLAECAVAEAEADEGADACFECPPPLPTSTTTMTATASEPRITSASTTRLRKIDRFGAGAAAAIKPPRVGAAWASSVGCCRHRMRASSTRTGERLDQRLGSPSRGSRVRLANVTGAAASTSSSTRSGGFAHGSPRRPCRSRRASSAGRR
jgi:hypothetical protein